MDKVSHEGLLPYENNDGECELDETNTSIVKFSSNPQGPFFVHFLLPQNS
jgi:hypothetical protein